LLRILFGADDLQKNVLKSQDENIKDDLTLDFLNIFLIAFLRGRCNMFLGIQIYTKHYFKGGNFFGHFRESLCPWKF